MSLLDLVFKFLSFLKRDLDDKLVDEKYLDASCIRKAIETEGFVPVWAKPEKIQSRLLKGYKYAYEYHRWWWRRKLIDNSGHVLLKKPQNTNSG